MFSNLEFEVFTRVEEFQRVLYLLGTKEAMERVKKHFPDLYEQLEQYFEALPKDNIKLPALLKAK